MSDTESEFSGFGEEDISDYAEIESVGSDISVSSVNTTDLSDFDDLETDSDHSAGGDTDSDDDLVPQFTDQLHAINIQPFEPYNHRFSHAIDVENFRELDFLNLFLDNNILNNITDQTNLFAEQQQIEKPDSKWIPTTLDEMKALLGINILQGVIEVPHFDFYWSDSDFWGNAGVKKTMPRDRFKSLSSYMYLNDNTTAAQRG